MVFFQNGRQSLYYSENKSKVKMLKIKKKRIYFLERVKKFI